MPHEKCCNKTMEFVEYVLRSVLIGFQYDVLGLYTCKNKMCLSRRGWAYRVRPNESFEALGWLRQDEIKKWVPRTNTEMVSRNDHKEMRAMVHVGEGTLTWSRDVASIYKKIVKDVRRARATQS